MPHLLAALLLTAGGANGTLCGASGCVALPPGLAAQLAQRNDTYTQLSRPAPAPYFAIHVRAHGEGYTSRALYWLPARRIVYTREFPYPYPPLDGYWRREITGTHAGLARLAAKLQAFAAPARWPTPKAP
jgi:hypothetical protein